MQRLLKQDVAGAGSEEPDNWSDVRVEMGIYVTCHQVCRPHRLCNPSLNSFQNGWGPGGGLVSTTGLNFITKPAILHVRRLVCDLDIYRPSDGNLPPRWFSEVDAPQSHPLWFTRSLGWLRKNMKLLIGEHSGQSGVYLAPCWRVIGCIENLKVSEYRVRICTTAQTTNRNFSVTRRPHPTLITIPLRPTTRTMMPPLPAMPLPLPAATALPPDKTPPLRLLLPARLLPLLQSASDRPPRRYGSLFLSSNPLKSTLHPLCLRLLLLHFSFVVYSLLSE